jgi:peptide/nickel transport system substrate-binding protein
MSKNRLNQYFVSRKGEKMFKKGLLAIFVILVCMSMVLAGCSSPEPAEETGPTGEDTSDTSTDDEPKLADTITYGTQTEPIKLDPQNDALLNAMLINKHIYNTLVKMDPETQEIIPSLATDWEWVDDTTLEMTLRDDVYFHNGTKFSAEDVLYTIRRYQDGKASASLLASFDGENSKVIDDTHIQIKLVDTYGPALNMLSSMKAAIVSKDYSETVDETTFSREPIGTGPYKFVSWVSGDKITLVRNEDYWGEKAKTENLVFKVIPDANARMIELETGGVDIIDTLNGGDIDRIKAGETEGIELYELPGTKVHYLTFNEADPILSKEEVHLAVAHALDVPTIVEAGFGSGAGVATSTMANSIFGHAYQGPYEFDLELSRELLAEAGVPDGFDTSMVIPDVSNNVRMAEAIQSMLKEIGINVEILRYDPATWQSLNRDGTALMSINNLTVDTRDPDHNYMNLYDTAVTQSYRTSDPTVNELLRKGRSELDPETRKAIYAELQAYIKEHAVWISLSEPIINFAVSEKIENFVPDPGVQCDLSGVTKYE